MADIKRLLDDKVKFYNNPGFISADPISVPHRFTKLQDIEISGFFASIFAWGNRTTIINKTLELMALMDNAPHDFILHAADKELKRLLNFKHRTFQTDDLLYFISFFKWYYGQNESLETAFTRGILPDDTSIENGLKGFRELFFSLPHLGRTKKHVSSPVTGSSCKRINMYLRWMVRRDDKGVDFGLWQNIDAGKLVCPLDVHVGRVARRLGLLERQTDDWQAARELTEALKVYDNEDPVKYDFALFSIGVMEKI